MMRQVTLDQPGRLVLDRGLAVPVPSPGEALVRVRRVGVCGTDLHAFSGRQPFFDYPRILGHELAVEVVEINGPSASVRVGDRCCVEPYLPCGTCGACRRNKTQCCEKLRVLGVHVDGGMREMFTVPVNQLHPGAELSLDQLALVETLCIGAHAVERARAKPGEACLVLGAGPIGLSVIQCLGAVGARIFAADVNEARLRFVRDSLGLQHTLNPQDGGEVEARLRDLCDGDLPVIVFDATGHRDSMMSAFDWVGFGGRIVFVGLFKGDVTFNDPNFHRREISLLASRNAAPATFRQVMAWVASGRLHTDAWITHRMSLADVPSRFSEIATQPGLVKAMIDVNGTDGEAARNIH